MIRLVTLFTTSLALAATLPGVAAAQKAGRAAAPAAAPAAGQAAADGQDAETIVVNGVSVPAYRVNVGDELGIYVWGDERLQRSLKVLPDGTFAFPLAGTVHAAGKTPVQVESELSKLLAPQYKGVPPQVTVSVNQASGLQVSVIGKVRSPGSIPLTRYINALDALTLAGGPADFADTNNIVIMRREGTTTRLIKTRLGNVLKGRPSPEDLSATGIPPLMAGDTVVVP